MKYILFILLLLNTVYCNAEIYTQTDGSGAAVYSDIPLSNSAKPVNLPDASEAQVSSEPSTSSSAVAPTEYNGEKKPYTTFVIVSPTNGETIQNQPVIPVQIKVEPELQKGDTIQVYLDGKPQGEPAAATTFNLSIMERGSHQLSATLLDEKKMSVKQFGSITIFVHRASTNQPSQKANQQSSSRKKIEDRRAAAIALR